MAPLPVVMARRAVNLVEPSVPGRYRHLVRVTCLLVAMGCSGNDSGSEPGGTASNGGDVGTGTSGSEQRPGHPRRR